MAITGTKLCPSCAKSIPPESTLCPICGKDFEDLYVIVPDGATYAISLQGESKIHGLRLDKAREIASLLNSVREMKD